MVDSILILRNVLLFQEPPSLSLCFIRLLKPLEQMRVHHKGLVSEERVHCGCTGGHLDTLHHWITFLVLERDCPTECKTLTFFSRK